MGIFDGIEKTEVQRRYESIKEKSPKVLEGEKARCKAMFDELWEGLTMAEAQAVLDLFGAEAFSLFPYHWVWQFFLLVAQIKNPQKVMEVMAVLDPLQKQLVAESDYQWLTPHFDVAVVEGRVVLSEKVVEPEPEPEPTPEEPS